MQLLLTRFDYPPEIIIYDNACNLHDFCVHREPDFFKTVQFIIDKLHVTGHKHCSVVYDPYKHQVVMNINTQVLIDRSIDR
jgi:hypothetical protein